MGSEMIVKVLTTERNMIKVFDQINLQILSVSDFGVGDTVEITFSGYWGYAEPIEYYEKLRGYIFDIWYICIDDDILKQNEETTTHWLSAKKKFVNGDPQ